MIQLFYYVSYKLQNRNITSFHPLHSLCSGYRKSKTRCQFYFYRFANFCKKSNLQIYYFTTK